MGRWIFTLMYLFVKILLVSNASPVAKADPNVNLLINIQVNQNKGEEFVYESLCSNNTTASQRIVNGKDVTVKDEYPWQVGILKRRSIKDPIVECGGTFITSKHILTAAHCFYVDPNNNPALCHISNDPEPKDFSVQYGGNNIKTNPFTKIQKVTIHKDYRCRIDKLLYDIAIIELRIEFNQQPIYLPENINRGYTGICGIVIGWGSTVGYNPLPSPIPLPRYPDVLKKATIPIVSITECRKAFPTLYRQFCAGTKKGFENLGGGVCHADSGGPFFIPVRVGVGRIPRHLQLGITSGGKGCASKGNPAVFTKVSEYLPWIRKTVKPTLINTVNF